MIDKNTLNDEKDFNNTNLSSSVTIGKYLKFKEAKDKKRIADFVKERFKERYIDPIDNKTTSGFCIMANCCLMIEALESFYNGWKDTSSAGQSQLAFCNFFDRVSSFSTLRGFSAKFYKHVRCGILHQAETTGGWRIWRIGNLFDPIDSIINATEFLRLLKKYLEQYKQELERADWDDEVWKNLIKKMDAIIKNCRRN